MTSPGLTLTGLALALAVLYANFRPWWKGGRDLKQLIPFGEGAVLGALATVCTGGILGWLAGCARAVANRVGDKGVSAVTGTGSSTPLSRDSLGRLTPEGAIVVALIAVAVYLAWKAAGKQDKRRMAGGAFCGATLCVTAGVAGALDWLPDAVNQAGGALRAAVEGAGVL